MTNVEDFRIDYSPEVYKKTIDGAPGSLVRNLSELGIKVTVIDLENNCLGVKMPVDKVDAVRGLEGIVKVNRDFQYDMEALRDYSAFNLELSASCRVLLEDGYSHPAEQVLARALSEPDGKSWVKRFYEENKEHSSSLEIVLRCLGSLSLGSEKFVYEIAGDALSHPAVEIRDAAVIMLEQWKTADSLSTLRDYLKREHVPYLRMHASGIVEELTKMEAERAGKTK